MGYTGRVSETGFTVLHEPRAPDQEADIEYEPPKTPLILSANVSRSIIFVHGFTGHPRDTWTLKNKKRTRQPDEPDEHTHSQKRSNIHRLLSFGRANSTPSSSSTAATVAYPDNASTSGASIGPTSSAHMCDVFWPADLLPHTVPTARILTFGYDTRVRHRFQGENSQNTVADHAKNFLSGLEARRCRPTEFDRPILFVVHSLGGIVIKEALRQSKASTHLNHLYNIHGRTIGCIFFGTPHRGSDLRKAYRHTIQLGEVLGWKPNKHIVDTLAPDSELLASLREEFPVMCHERRWMVQSFQEEYGLGVLGGKKVVDDTSSCLNDPVIERREHIASNHMDMCRFSRLDDSGYHQVAAAINRIISKTKELAQSSLADHQNHHPPLPHRFLHHAQHDQVMEDDSADQSVEQHDQDMEDDQAGQSTAQDTGGQQSSVTLNRGATNAQSSKGSIDETLREELVQKLYFDRIDERLTGLSAAYGKTCRWFLEKPEYMSWLGTEHLVEHGGFLWIKGNPGTGKSTLMKFLFEKAKRDASDDPSHIHLSFFFNARGDADEKSTMGLYRSLLHQLFEHTPDLAGSLDWMTLDGARGIQRSGWHEEALKQTLKHATEVLGNRSLTIFVDALDECDQTQVMDMVEAFEELCDLAQSWKVNLRICFSSRHYPTITIQTGLELVLEHEAGHEEDIRTYIRSKLRLGKTKQAETLRTEILEKSAGIFLWIVLVIEILNREFPQGSITQFRARLKEIPPKLHELFEMILKRDGDNLDRLRICFNLILFAKRPLKPQELYFAIQLGLDTSSKTSWDEEDVSMDQMKNYVSTSSKGLAQITRNKASEVQFIHESVRDFLLGKHGSQWCEAPENTEGSGHKMLRDCCLAQLQATAPELLDSLAYMVTLRNRLTSEYPFLEYSIQYVLHHSDEAQRLGIDQSSFLSQFPLDLWVVLNNALEKFDNRKYSKSVSMFYALAEKDASHLIAAHPDCAQLCCKFENERYGTPIIAALATGTVNAARAMYSSIREYVNRQPALSDIQTWILKTCQNMNEEPQLLPREFTLGRDEDKFLAKIILADNWALLAHWLLPPNTPHPSEQDELKAALFLAVQTGIPDLVTSVLTRLGDTKPGPRETNSPRATDTSCQGSTESFAGETIHINTVDEAGCSPFWYAMKHGHKSIISILLEKGADVDICNKKGFTQFWLALTINDETLMQRLLASGSDIEKRLRERTRLEWDAQDITPLGWAAQRGYESRVHFLLEHGAKTDAKNRDGRTPLSSAALLGHGAVVQQLLEKDVDIETRDHGDRTPLSLAADQGHEAVVQQLLDKGAAIEARDDEGRTPLWWAVCFGRRAVVQLLLEKGAAIEARDDEGRTPLWWAVCFGRRAVVQLLLEKGAAIETRDDEGRTPFSWAATGREGATTKLFLDQGAEIESRDTTGRTPLSWAARNVFQGARPLCILIEEGAEVDTRDNSGRTALSWAATNIFWSDGLKKLLAAGANPALRDLEGKSPLDWAKEQKWSDRVELMEEALAKSGRPPG